MKLDRFAPSEITVTAGLRALNAEAVRALAESISKVGLQSPPTVRWVTSADGEGHDVVLVAGRHRLAAVQQLGWDTVECVVVKMDEHEARLWEIAENLHRAELTVQERADHIAEWVRLTAVTLSAQVAQKATGGRPEGGLSAAVRDLGIDRTEAQRAVKIASMAPETKEACAADPDIASNQGALLRIAAEPSPERQLAQVKAERDRIEARKRNRETDRDIATIQAEQYAEWLMERTDLNELTVVMAWIECAKPKDVLNALRRRTA